VTCYATEDTVRIVNSFYLQSHTQSLTIISYAVTRLHNYNSYTPIFHSLIVSITHIHTSNKHSFHTLRNCFLPRTYCLALTLKNWTKPANRFAYIARTRETKNRASQLCYVRSPCLQRRYLGNERGAVWRHRGVLCSNHGAVRNGTEKTPLSLLLRSVYSVASCLPVGYLATLCCVIQHWVNMSQYNDNFSSFVVLLTDSRILFPHSLLPIWSIRLISQFLDDYTDGRSPWTGDQLVARPLPKHRTTQTQNKRIHTPNIRALCGIRIHDPGFRVSEECTCLWPLGYRDLLL
jgi:hypothetical protein